MPEMLILPSAAGITGRTSESFLHCAGLFMMGGGFIGVGEPSAAQKEGHFFQLYDVLGVDKEVGFSLSQDKYNWQEQEHFLKEGLSNTPELGEEIRNIYALRNTRVLINERQNVRFATNEYGKGRSVYLSGLPFSFENARLLYRCLFYAAGKEADIKRWYSENCNVEVNVYPNTDSYCVVNIRMRNRAHASIRIRMHLIYA